MVRKKKLRQKTDKRLIAQKKELFFLPWLLNGTLFLFFAVAPMVVYSALDPVAGQPFFTLYDLPKTGFIMAFVLLQMGIYFLSLALDRNESRALTNFIRANSGVKILLLLLLWQAFSIINAAVTSTAFFVLFQWLILAGGYVLWARLFSRASGRWSAVYGLVAALAVFNFIGILQFFGFKIFFLLPILGPSATLGYRNPAAHFLVYALPFVLFAASCSWRLWRENRRNPHLYGLAGLIIVVVSSVVLVFMNYSRTAILALMLEVLVLPFIWLRYPLGGTKIRFIGRGIAMMMMALLLISVLIYAFPKSRERVSKSWNRIQQSPARLLEFRYYHWGNTLMMIKENPMVGVGVGNWRINYPLYYKSFSRDPLFNYKIQMRRTHNDYLQLAAECGIPALLLFLLLWGRQFYLLRYSSRERDGEEDWRLPLAASLLAFSVIMFFSFPMQMAYSRMFCFFLLALGEARAWPVLSK